MKKLAAGLLALFSFQAAAQLSPEQKLIDFQQLVGLFAKRYAFYEWKRQAIQFDGLAIQAWLDRIRNTKDDLEYFEICAEYVASYQDGHASFLLPSTFRARLGLSVDFYEGKPLIDSIDRNLLPAATFPFEIGDQIVSFDGKPVMDAIQEIARLSGEGNPRSLRRSSAGLLTSRYQSVIPRAHLLPDKATLVIQRQSGATATYDIPWQKSGIAYRGAGPVPTPKTAASTSRSASGEDPEPEPEVPSYMRRLRSLQNFKLGIDRFMLGFGAVNPVFDLPETFIKRLGGGRFDSIFTGTIEYDGLKIGYMRIPQFPSFVSTSILQREITYLETNTDGLVVDVTRNPGGSICSTESIVQRLTRSPFQTLGARIRVTWNLLMGAQEDLETARQFGGSDSEIAELENLAKALQKAYEQNRGLTDPLPLCSSSLEIQPAKNDLGEPSGYSHPILLLTDELSFSAAELFAAILQDNDRAKLYGMRTDGAGGAVVSFDVGHYMEASASLPIVMAIRKTAISTPEYPSAPLIENIGVRPNIADDYMTQDNLTSKGKPFVERFLKAAADHIRSSR